MLYIALFISGRLLCYKEHLIPLLNYLITKYEIKLFLSINSDQDNEAIKILRNLLGYYEFKRFFYEDDWIENRLKNNIKYMGSYNQLSMFYNDLNNFNLIEKYEKDKSRKFDLICKIRPDMTFINLNDLVFTKDEEDECCFGNKKSMKIYCNTYNWVKENDIELKGLYNNTFEPYLNDNLFGHVFYNPFNKNPQLTYKELEDLMVNNKRNLLIKYLPWKYDLSLFRRECDKSNQPVEGRIINGKQYIWQELCCGLCLKE
jgi:hypothetical protein